MPDKINLGGCFVAIVAVVLNLPVSMPMDLLPPPCLHLFGCLLASDFLKE